MFCADFRKNIAHRFRDDIGQFEEKRIVKAEGAPVANRATQNATQNVTASFVRRNDSVGDREAKGTDVIGDNPKGDVDLFMIAFTGSSMFRKSRSVFLAAEFFQLVEDRTKDVGLVVRDCAGELGEVFCALNDCGGALQT